MVSKENNILRQNFNYFKNEIEPYYFLLYNTKNQAIVIDVRPENLSHLLGIKKSSNAIMGNMNAFELYNYLLDNEEVSNLFEIINYERYKNNELSLDEEYVLYKNMYFIDIFESFIPEHDIRVYRNIESNINGFKADYLHVKKYEVGRGYLGIIGNDINDFHFFNSIRYDKEYEIKGTKYLISRIEKVHKKDFDEMKNKIIFVKSKRNENNFKKSSNKKNNKRIDFKVFTKEINKKLPKNYQLKVGEFSKKSIQLYHEKIRLEDHFEDKIREQSVEEIVDFIIKEYTNK